MQQETTFTIIMDAQEMHIRYRPKRFADYGHFEFTSPHTPLRRIPLSETGYRSHFSPMHEIEEAPSFEEYARALALALMRNKSAPDNSEEEEAPGQFVLF